MTRRGFTLVELMISVAVMGVMGLLFDVTSNIVERRASEELQRARAALGARLAGAHFKAQHGNASQVILRELAEGHYDVVILRAGEGPREGELAEAVAQRAAIPLLVLKGVGPTVVQRPEQGGIASLRQRAAAEPSEFVASAAGLTGASCRKNSPQARAAFPSASQLAHSRG